MDARVTRATVFLQGAAITRSLTTELFPGKHTVRFLDLPDSLTPKSVTARVNGDAQLLSVTCVQRRAQAPKEKISRLQGQLAVCEDEIAQVLAQLEILRDESLFLKENQKIGGTQGTRLEDLKTAADYYHLRLHEISSKQLCAQKEKKRLEADQKALLSRLKDCQREAEKAAVEVEVSLLAPEKGEIEVELSYFVPCAGWRPAYEIRVKDIEGPALLLCKGLVYQNTGEDWKEVSLTLSSGMPISQGGPQTLQPWYLNVEQPIAAAAGCAGLKAGWEEAECRSFECAGDAGIRQACTSVEFLLPGPVSVASTKDGQPVELARHELPAVYQHQCIPKLDNGVYLMAKIEGWESLNLLEGEAGIFLGGAYTGSTLIDPQSADDLLELCLGKDSGVIVTRTKGRDFAGHTLMGLNNRASREWIITVRNTRHSAVSVRIVDQIPVSVSKAVTVEPVELSGGALDESTGELSWERVLEPGASIRLVVRYAVVYPKKEQIFLE